MRFDYDTHIPESDLVLAANGELGSRQCKAVHAHLETCWTCRTRMKQLEETITGFVRARQESLQDSFPPADGPRALLRAQLAALAATHAPTWSEHLGDAFLHGERLARLGWMAGAVAVTTTILLFVGVRHVSNQGFRLVPDPRLTPGVALNVSTAEICSRGSSEKPHLIPASVGRQVFNRYGIEQPRPKAYELDYLIAPELGGADDPRNYWPQPYGTTEWNAHVKDALEDQLYTLVCEQKIALTVAQHDISADWIQAYKKYFHVDRPIASHTRYSKDQPWQ